MANATAQPRTFSRGSTVLDYWLVHAEGMTVQPLGARVEEVVVMPPEGHAETLIVRSRMTRRRRKIPADSITAVEPTAGTLLLEPNPRANGQRIGAARAGAQRSGRYARAHVAGAARATVTGTRNAVNWTRPRAASVRTQTAHGAAWLAPRVVLGARAAGRATLAGAALVAYGGAVAARELEGGVRVVMSLLARAQARGADVARARRQRARARASEER